MTRERELAGRAFRLTNPGFDGRTQLVQGTMDRLGESVQNGRRQRVESAKVRSHRKSGRFGDVLATLDHNSLLPFRGGSAPAPPRPVRLAGHLDQACRLAGPPGWAMRHVHAMLRCANYLTCSSYLHRVRSCGRWWWTGGAAREEGCKSFGRKPLH